MLAVATAVVFFVPLPELQRVEADLSSFLAWKSGECQILQGSQVAQCSAS
jgi:hypothetical protein